MKIVISSGHGLYVRGASGILDEVDEARKVVEALATELRRRGVEVITYHDDVSTTQSENLDRIVDFHNDQVRDFDCSIHFNCSDEDYVTKPIGTECLYVTQYDIAAEVSEAIAAVGFIDRGAKKRTDLAFLNGTAMPSVLVEVCFVNSEEDARIYNQEFDNIIRNLAKLVETTPVPIEPPEREEGLFHAVGPCSYFGGPSDTGVDSDEGVAFLYSEKEAPHLFLATQPEGTTGLARRLNPYVHYLACRWDYSVTPKEMLAGMDMALVRAPKTGREALAFPADWGPHDDTGRIADLSPSLMLTLGIETDDEVEVIYPWSET